MATIEYEDGARGGEAYFVPRSQDPEQCGGRSQMNHIGLSPMHGGHPTTPVATDWGSIGRLWQLQRHCLVLHACHHS